MSKIFNLIFVIAVALLAYWGHGYYQMKKSDEISFERYVQSNIEANQKKLSDRYSSILGRFNLKALDSDIKADDRLKKGAISQLSEAIGIYQAEYDRLPAANELEKIYRDGRDVLSDATFTYSTSTDGKHFEVSVKLKNGEAFKLNR
jgi:hypothetical protein